MASSSLSGLNLPDVFLPIKELPLCFASSLKPGSYAYVHISGCVSVELSCICLFPASFGEGSVPKDLNQGGNISIYLNGCFNRNGKI